MKSLKEIEEEYTSFTQHIQKAFEDNNEADCDYWMDKKVQYYKDNIYNTDIKTRLLDHNPDLKYSFRAMEKLINEME